ncbi:MAG TPA: PilZ domain-containing protein, partial [Gemmatales bacterium]|nr:PilZ domain-containing protein [Gemmatales bacterium]
NTLNQWREQRRSMELDLKLLPVHEHEVLIKALDFEPARRFANCTSFLEHLIQSFANSSGYRMKALDQRASESSLLLTGETIPTIPPDEVDIIVRRLIEVVAMRTVYNQDKAIRFIVDEKGVVIHRCAAWLPGGLAINKLEGFAHEWNAHLVEVNDEKHEYVYHIRMRQKIWQKMLGRKSEFIEIRIRMNPPREPNVKQTEVEIRICYTDSRPENERDRLEIVVPALLCSLRTFLLAKNETRTAERYQYESKVYLYPIYVNNIGDPVVCHSRDISTTGIRVFSQSEFTSTDCIVQIHTQEFGSIVLPAKLQRCEPLSTGMYDIGLKF